MIACHESFAHPYKLNATSAEMNFVVPTAIITLRLLQQSSVCHARTYVQRRFKLQRFEPDPHIVVVTSPVSGHLQPSWLTTETVPKQSAHAQTPLDTARSQSNPLNSHQKQQLCLEIRARRTLKSDTWGHNSATMFGTRVLDINLSRLHIPATSLRLQNACLSRPVELFQFYSPTISNSLTFRIYSAPECYAFLIVHHVCTKESSRSRV